MSKVLALDIETKNFAHEIGGWQNTHMFLPSVVCTWDGDIGKIYIDEQTDNLVKSNIEVKKLSELKFDLDDHLQKGGLLLGHNIVNFDLPVLRDSMDIYCVKSYLNRKAYIDTSREVTKSSGQRYSLNNLVKHTLGDSKLMDGANAPVLWKQGEYEEVAEYCLKDCKLVYDLWKHGVDNRIVKGFSIDDEEEKVLEGEW